MINEALKKALINKLIAGAKEKGIKKVLIDLSGEEFKITDATGLLSKEEQEKLLLELKTLKNGAGTNTP